MTKIEAKNWVIEITQYKILVSVKNVIDSPEFIIPNSPIVVSALIGSLPDVSEEERYMIIKEISNFREGI